MAEVMSPSMPASSSITMLHSRPSSSDAFQGPSQQYPQQSPRLGSGQSSRSMYNGQNTGYRGTSAAPVQPYAFQSTPNLRQDTRTTSAPSASHGAIGSHRHAHTQSVSASSTASSDASSQPSAKGDSVMGSRNGSLINLSSNIPDLSLTTFDQPAKPSPDRYRRPAQKRTESGNVTPKATTPQPSGSAAGSGPATVSHLVQQQPTFQRQESVDDMAMAKSGNSELAKRYRRRSFNNMDISNLQTSAGASQRPTSGHGTTSTPPTLRPASSHQRKGSDDSQSSQRGKNAPAKEQNNSSSSLHPDQKGINVPARTSSETGKRMKTPSPLSKETSESNDPTPVGSPVKQMTYAAAAQAGVRAQSRAAQQLAAVSDKDLNKGMKSRLRRAFSFGSAQELRRGAAENSNAAVAAPAPAHTAQQTREQHQQQIDDELDAEQQEIARRQEEAGIGAGIYSGQGGFTGSTDNLSISSTASSASMMLRKMGRGAKKSARSIKGLFRPKSVIGVPAADGPISVSPSAAVQPSVAQVSMVTVEAERQKVNVNEHVADKPHGITGFPKLERNSIENGIGGLATRGSADGSESISRRSIVGSDKDRAEVLAAVKKGILKRSGTGSPSGSPVIRPTDAGLSAVPNGSESPASSMPSTPKDGQSQSDLMRSTANGDYFSPRMATMTKSMPNTPNGTARGITFSPRIQFHDAWSSSEYDRRGEIATCNRLTPMLAQQIKEELNTFKMEMEVHEASKPHTHFF